MLLLIRELFRGHVIAHTSLVNACFVPAVKSVLCFYPTDVTELLNPGGEGQRGGESPPGLLEHNEVSYPQPSFSLINTILLLKAAEHFNVFSYLSQGSVF